MSIDTMTPATDQSGEPTPRRWYEGRNLTILIAVVGLVVVSLARVISDADRITSSIVVGTGLRLAIPIALAGLGGLYAERSGTVNIGLEGMMTMGTVMAGYAGWQWGWLAAFIGGAVGGMLGGLLMSLATTTFGVNHIIAGFAINILGPGVARFLANVWFTTADAAADGGSITSSPPIGSRPPRFSVPILSDGPDLLGDLEDKGWFFLSDGAGILRGLTHELRFGTLLAVALIIGSTYLIWRTPFGLRLRSAGEKPSAGESLGVQVIWLRHIGMAISGALAGIGGAVLVFAGANQYQEGQVAGRGFLGLAALVFGNWMPSGLLMGASVFGYAQGVSISLDSGFSVMAIVLAVGIALLLLSAVEIFRRRYVAAVLEIVVGVAALITYGLIEEANRQFVFITPYVVTLVVITIFAQRQRPPAAEGIPYFKGQSL